LSDKQREKRALVIGVSQYEHTEPLEFCRNDGEEMFRTLDSLGYRITEKLIGYVKWNTMSDAIIDFFTDQSIAPSDTLLFYYSGHGVPDIDGDMYLSTSEIDSTLPDKRGFSFNRLTKLIQRSISLRIVTILDCCYSGAARVSKGSSKDDASVLGYAAIRNSSRILEGEGKCILAASQGLQEAFALEEHNHSIYTYFLLQGLKGNRFSVDENGIVTPDTLSRYVYNEMMSLPTNKRPRQIPFKRVETSGDIILAHYPELAKREWKDAREQSSDSHTDPEVKIKQLWEKLEDLRAYLYITNSRDISKLLKERENKIKELRRKAIQYQPASEVARHELTRQIDELQEMVTEMEKLKEMDLKLRARREKFSEKQEMVNTIDRMVVKYVNQRKGPFDIARCAEDLGLSKTKVREIISRLGLI
jgi:hypothetical protein